MTTTGKARARLGMLSLAAVALLAAGCGTEQTEDTAEVGQGAQETPATRSTPSAQEDFLCPGESPGPTASPTTAARGAAVPPADHYAENHGFRVPLTLRGQSRCDGLTAVGRVQSALEPLRRRGDFVPQHAQNALGDLGYPDAKVRAYQNGPTGVGFLIDVGASPWCVEGTMSRDATVAGAFAGYPDGTGCEPPAGGH